MGEKWRPELCVLASAREHYLGSFTFFDFYFSRSLGTMYLLLFTCLSQHILFSLFLDP